MITAHNALSTRRRGSNTDGQNDWTRSFGIRNPMSPAGSIEPGETLALLLAELAPVALPAVPVDLQVIRLHDGQHHALTVARRIYGRCRSHVAQQIP